MPRKMTPEEFVTKVKRFYSDRYDCSKIKYVGSKTKVVLVCPTHGEFVKRPDELLRGHGCQRCSFEIKNSKLQLFQKSKFPQRQFVFIQSAKRVHGNKYDYSKVNYRGQDKDVIIVCKKHGDFSQTPYNHLREHGCPYCSGNKICKENCFANTHPEKAKYWDYDKNGSLTPESVISHGRVKIWWKCSVADDHVWLDTISNRKKCESVCPFCSGDRVCQLNCLAATHPQIAVELCQIKDGYTVSFSSNKKLWWKCPVEKDHIWDDSPNHRTRERGCPYCSGNRVCNSNCLVTTHPEIAAQWDFIKNGILTPNDVTKGSTKKVWWLCPKGHVSYKARIDHRTIMNSGCPICKESKGEQAIRLHLEQCGVVCRSQWKFKKSTISKSSFDFAIQRGVIEYQGRQHYAPCSFGSKKEYADIRGLVSAMRRDLKKERWCKKHNVPLLVIPYWDFDRIPETLDAFIAGGKPVMSGPPELVLKYGPMRKKILARLREVENVIS